MNNRTNPDGEENQKQTRENEAAKREAIRRARAAKEHSAWCTHYARLIGKTVNGLAFDNESIPGQTCYGLRFTDGTIAFIMCDPEGNGPGFLEIQGNEKASSQTAAK